MRYAKLIDGFPVYSRNPIKYNGRWIGNPPTEILMEMGYKPVHQDPYPSEDPPAGYYWELAWTEDVSTITGYWRAAPLEPDHEADPE